MRLLARNLRFETRPIWIKGKALKALVADTPRKMAVGLMFRRSMKPNECMLFVFPDYGTHPIWMRNMRFPIDILWLDDKRSVVELAESAKPTSGFDFSSYRPRKPSRYVLELNAGFTRKNKIKRNDVAKFGV